MTWHHFPHLPEHGAHVLVQYKGSQNGNYFEVVVREEESFSHIEKWCYYDDYRMLIDKRLKEIQECYI